MKKLINYINETMLIVNRYQIKAAEETAESIKNWRREMITENQRDYIIGLYNELNMEIDIEELSKSEAHKRIQELLELKSEVY